MASKRKLAAMAPVDEDPVDPSDEFLFLCLGGGNEVGRSCHIIQYKGKTIMVRRAYIKREDGLLMARSLMRVCTLGMRACPPCPTTMNSI
jgi:hypothetical protein